jgi:hypothetical protein
MRLRLCPAQTPLPMARRSSSTALRLFLLAALLALASAGLFGGSKAAPTKSAKATTVESLQIGIKSRPAECTTLAKDGDRVWVHYKGTLLATGEKFDASCAYGRKRVGGCTRGADGGGALEECCSQLTVACASFSCFADDRNQPFDFTLGQGNVIKGWDLGVAGMCPGEVRKLKVCTTECCCCQWKAPSSP